MAREEQGLRKSAGQGLLWGVAFNLGRDVIQFLSMLILVRLLTPQIYGQFALAQTIQLFLAVASFKTFAPFALQARDPSIFDWKTHFSAGVTMNAIMMAVTLIIAAGFCFLGGEQMETVGFVLAIMSLGFPIEVMSTHYFTWLQAHHQWKRLRLLLLFGTLAAAVISVVLAAVGGGIIALAVGNLLFVLPLIADFFVRKPFPLTFRPNWFPDYREGRAFGMNRVGAASLKSGSALAEHSILSGLFGFATLGVFTRSIGLAQITSGRIGPVVTQTLYPVLSRAEPRSERFRRFANILFQGVLWISAPAAVFLALEADDLVRVFYGAKWLDVIPLMGAAAAVLALRGLHLTMNQIMLANLQQRACLVLDLAAALTMLVTIFCTVMFGPLVYLLALTGHAALIVAGTAYFAQRGGAIDARAAAGHIFACAAALALAATAVLLIPDFYDHRSSLFLATLALVCRGVVFSVVYIIALRLIATGAFIGLIHALPLPGRLSKVVSFLTVIPRRIA